MGEQVEPVGHAGDGGLGVLVEVIGPAVGEQGGELALVVPGENAFAEGQASGSARDAAAEPEGETLGGE